MNDDIAPPQRLVGRIKRVSIHGFRSLKSVDNLEIPQLAVLIGVNGAGKSNFIRFFEMLGWMLRGQKLQEFVMRNGGGDDQLYMGARNTPRMDACVRIETQAGLNDYEFALGHVSADDSLLFVHEAYRHSIKEHDSEAAWKELPGPNKEASLLEYITQDKTAQTAVNILKRCVTYQFHDTSTNAYIRQPWDVDDYNWMRSDGANLAPVLLYLQNHDIRRYKLIVKQVSRVLPGFDDFELQPAFGKVQIRWRSTYNGKTFGPHLTSDGSLRLFCLLTLLNMPGEMMSDVLFFDEPELGLHPQAIMLVSDMIKRVAQTRQVFIATQSPYMVDCFSLENIIVAKTVEGATSLQCLPRSQYEQWLTDDYLISDLWMQNVFESEI